MYRKKMVLDEPKTPKLGNNDISNIFHLEGKVPVYSEN